MIEKIFINNSFYIFQAKLCWLKIKIKSGYGVEGPCWVARPILADLPKLGRIGSLASTALPRPIC